MSKIIFRAASAFFLLAAAITTPHEAHAIPSFAAQTGQPCSACHVGAFGPQLKPYGRDFKMYGYVTSDRSNDTDYTERFSMMMQTSFTHTAKDNSPGGIGYGPNDNFSLDQMAVYYGGRITPTIGGIAEFTYDGANRAFTWDAMDIRHAHEGSVLGLDYVGGVMLGNQLGNTSIWNSTPPNAFPYNSSRIAPTPLASTLFDDSLNSQILGPGAYVLLNDWIYADMSVYFPLSRNFDQATGNPASDKYNGPIPFWHLAVQHDFDAHQHYFQLGTFGAIADRFPNGDQSMSTTDNVTDLAAEANYQWMPNGSTNMLSAHATYVHETDDWAGTLALNPGSQNTNDHLDEFKADVSYSIDNTYTPTIQYFRTTGSKDAGLWGVGAGGNDPNGSPDSEGYTVDLAYVPFGKPDSPGYNWGNMRLALEYTGYTRFNGIVDKASDNNTIFLNFWMALAPLVPILGHDTPSK